MKILYVSDSYPPVVNGLSYVVEHLAHIFVEKGHDVEVITLGRSYCLSKVEERDGVTVKRFLGFSPGRSYHFPSPKMIYELKRSFDVLHVHNFHSVLPLVCSMAYMDYNRLQVVTPHYHAPGHHLHSKIAWLLYKPLLQQTISRYDIVHCVSRFEAECVTRDFDVRPIIVENGVDEDVYNFRWAGYYDNIFNVTWVGRLEKYKRLDWVIIAASIIMKKGYKVKVNVVGSGPETFSIIRLAQRLKVDLRMIKHLPRDSYLRLLSESSCVVNPSSYEAFSIVCAEALAIGVPTIVVYPWGVNFQSYERAIIVNPDVDSIADGILESKGLIKTPTRPIPTWNEVAEAIYNKVYTSNGK